MITSKSNTKINIFGFIFQTERSAEFPKIALFSDFRALWCKTVSLMFWCEEGASSYFIFPSFFEAIMAKWGSEKTGHVATNSTLARFLNMVFFFPFQMWFVDSFFDFINCELNEAWWEEQY